MAKKTIIYWRDIPSQVLAQSGRIREKAMLSARFQEAIDRAAMRAGKGSSDAYIAEWRRVNDALQVQPGDLKNDLQKSVLREAERIENEYSDERLLELIRAHGVDQSSAETDLESEKEEGMKP
ncbi:MAG: virulence factor [Xanthomonadales bacterium]|nr:virulence factor [Xanthomonadales bacterium]